MMEKDFKDSNDKRFQTQYRCEEVSKTTMMVRHFKGSRDELKKTAKFRDELINTAKFRDELINTAKFRDELIKAAMCRDELIKTTKHRD